MLLKESIAENVRSRTQRNSKEMDHKLLGCACVGQAYPRCVSWFRFDQ